MSFIRILAVFCLFSFYPILKATYHTLTDFIPFSKKTCKTINNKCIYSLAIGLQSGFSVRKSSLKTLTMALYRGLVSILPRFQLISLLRYQHQKTSLENRWLHLLLGRFWSFKSLKREKFWTNREVFIIQALCLQQRKMRSTTWFEKQNYLVETEGQVFMEGKSLHNSDKSQNCPILRISKAQMGPVFRKSFQIC